MILHQNRLAHRIRIMEKKLKKFYLKKINQKNCMLNGIF